MSVIGIMLTTSEDTCLRFGGLGLGCHLTWSGGDVYCTHCRIQIIVKQSYSDSMYISYKASREIHYHGACIPLDSKHPLS